MVEIPNDAQLVLSIINASVEVQLFMEHLTVIMATPVTQ